MIDKQQLVNLTKAKYSDEEIASHFNLSLVDFTMELGKMKNEDPKLEGQLNSYRHHLTGKAKLNLAEQIEAGSIEESKYLLDRTVPEFNPKVTNTNIDLNPHELTQEEKEHLKEMLG